MSKENHFGSKGWPPERISSLNGKTYLITGATQERLTLHLSEKAQAL